MEIPYNGKDVHTKDQIYLKMRTILQSVKMGIFCV
jgi:hypothetical protein